MGSLKKYPRSKKKMGAFKKWGGGLKDAVRRYTTPITGSICSMVTIEKTRRWCLVFRHIPFCEGKVNNYPKQYSYYFCKHLSSPPFFYNYLRLFFTFVADGFGEVWAGILPPGEHFDLLVQAMSNPVCCPRGCIKTICSMVTIEKTRRWVILD